AAGAVYMLYRGAAEIVHRNEILLVSPRPGAEFRIVNSHPWNVAACPMSSATLAEGKQGVLAAWENPGQGYYAVGNPKTMQVSQPVAPPGATKRKHPAVVANEKGETLFVWTEGTAWAKGGFIAWQLFDKDGSPTAETGRADGVPVWSLATAFAKPDGDFV